MTATLPAEWEAHDAVWTAWPAHGELWRHHLRTVQEQVAAMVRAIVDGQRGERVNLLCCDDEALACARDMLADLGINFHLCTYGDIWLRDTGPIFLKGQGGLTAAAFGFNGWGQKYILPGDTAVADSIAKITRATFVRHDWILEGGAIETDGTGIVMTTEQCLLNPNRNPGLSIQEVERRLRQDCGMERVIWLGDGLANDHTDGHIDNLARFIAPSVVLVPEALDADDPNRDAYIDARRRVQAAGLDVATVPSPGRITCDDGALRPASYLNFYISNSKVIVPLYNSRYDDLALQGISSMFPGRDTVGIVADHLLYGGGAFHCITQQQPRM